MENSELESKDFDVLRNKGVINMEKLFKAKLKAIEDSHVDYFKSKESHIKSEPHDYIRNHFSYLQRGKDVTLFWEEKSDLKESIKHEVADLLLR